MSRNGGCRPSRARRGVYVAIESEPNKMSKVELVGTEAIRGREGKIDEVKSD